MSTPIIDGEIRPTGWRDRLLDFLCRHPPAGIDSRSWKDGSTHRCLTTCARCGREWRSECPETGVYVMVDEVPRLGIWL